MKRLLTIALAQALVSCAVFALDDIPLPRGGDFYGVGGNTAHRAPSLVSDGNLTVGGSATITGSVNVIGGVYGVGTGLASNGVCTASHITPCVQKTVLTFAAITHTFTDGSDEGESQLLYTFPEGRVYILGAAIDAAVTNNAGYEASANDIWYGAIGTAAAGDDGDLTSTEADIIAKTTFDTASGEDGHHEWEADMTAGADTVFDGTATAVSLYFNAAAADTSIKTGNATAGIQAGGTLTIYWVLLGDD
jgi:hypothetical protein